MAALAFTQGSELSLIARLRDVRDQASAALAARRVYRTTLNELYALDARELADLGMNSTMIRSVALEAAYGKKD